MQRRNTIHGHLTAPPQQTVTEAYSGPATSGRQIPDFASWVEDLASTGYSAVETGYGLTR